jgi:phytoene dehydrogenase-like protein
MQHRVATLIKPGKPDRLRQLDRDRFDAVIVGAGTGGLTCAAMLAERGLRVLVLDQHSVAGGNATVFRRKGYEFDVGLHYIGGCHPGGLIPRVLAKAGVRDVEFEELDPDGYDTFVFPSLTFRMPKGLDALRARLLEHFPAERRGIDRFVKLVGQVQRLERGLAQPARAALDLLRSGLAIRYARSTYAEFLDSCTRDPRLRAVLAGQCGDYALPPSKAAALIGAGMVAHFTRGAYFPRGGGQVLSDRLAESIERNGGKILLLATVRRICVENGRATGVEFVSKHLGPRRVNADVIVSNADLKRTMLDLVDGGALREQTRRRVAAYEMAPALGAIYLGLDRDLRAEGHPRTNYWIYPSYDLEREYHAVARGDAAAQPFAFISIASVKDPTNLRAAPAGVTNLQVMGLASGDPSAWGVTEADVWSGAYRDHPDYLRTKHEWAERLLTTAERVFPELRRQIRFMEVATPLTHTRYTLSSQGTSYGIAATPAQFLFGRPSARTEIENLYLCGASCRTVHGIAGVMMSGWMAARAITASGVQASERERRAGAVTVMEPGQADDPLIAASGR